WQSFGKSRVTLGPAALVRIVGTQTEIILNTNRTQTFEPDVYSNLGLDPLSKDILLVKSTNHFHAGFLPIAAEIVYIDAGAPYPSNPRVTDYRKLARPIWPRVENPHGCAPWPAGAFRLFRPLERAMIRGSLCRPPASRRVGEHTSEL